MLNSKIQVYLEIVKLLREQGPQTFSQINFHLKKIDSSALKKIIDFLTNNRMIVKDMAEIDQRFAIAERGIHLLDFFCCTSQLKN